MRFVSLPVLLLAAVLDSPALWAAFVTRQMDYTSALTRYLIAVVVAAVMVAMLRGMANGYLRAGAGKPAEVEQPVTPGRRQSDAADEAAA